jgi:LuxR family maltose regulon positive regulatory protein
MATRATQVDASGGVTSQDDPELWQAAVAAGLFQTVATEVSDSPVLLEALAGFAPAEWVDRLRRTTGSGGGGVGVGVVEPPWPGERLTARELDVLRMLPSRLTQSEIAEELGVSVNTVKYHVKVVYRKLGVASRSEAATAAARMARARPHAQVPGPGHASAPRSDRDVG